MITHEYSSNPLLSDPDCSIQKPELFGTKLGRTKRDYYASDNEDFVPAFLNREREPALGYDAAEVEPTDLVVSYGKD